MANNEYVVTGLEIGSQPEDAQGEIWVRGIVNGKPVQAFSNDYLCSHQAKALLIQEYIHDEDMRDYALSMEG